MLGLLGELLFTIAVVLIGTAALIVYAVRRRSFGWGRRVAWFVALTAASVAWAAGYRNWIAWTVLLVAVAVADMVLPIRRASPQRVTFPRT